MASAARKNFDDIVDVMLWQDSSDDSSSSEDELDDLLLEFMFPLQNDKSYPRINLQDIPDVQCKAMFRFAKGDMKRLRDALQLPANYICSQGTIATGMEALMILLRRLAYPNRWCDLVPVFGRTVSELSLIFNKVKLLLCSFIFPVEVACILLSMHFRSWMISMTDFTTSYCR
ncbi:uncharacterized protein LOC141892072 isoform X2 [Acropora palmata]|uniref:uncharacterized protein LOC141892072 isoform X2 n=1 Tax=Acropora palmata TaxID=6131 RepID=UPI003DA13E7C